MPQGWKVTEVKGALIPTAGIALVEFRTTKSLTLRSHMSMEIGVAQSTLD